MFEVCVALKVEVVFPVSMSKISADRGIFFGFFQLFACVFTNDEIGDSQPYLFPIDKNEMI